MFTCTATEFAEANHTEYAIAFGVLKFLKHKGLVKDGGTRPNKAGRGKPSQLYIVPASVTVEFLQPVAQAA